MRYVVTIHFSRKNSAGVTEDSRRFCDNVQATDEKQAALLYEETVRSNEPDLIAIQRVLVQEYEDGFQRGDD